MQLYFRPHSKTFLLNLFFIYIISHFLRFIAKVKERAQGKEVLQITKFPCATTAMV